jgi:FlaG/FlaF family flagellin (archaellin)
MATIAASGFPVESITRKGLIEPFDLQVGRGMIPNHQPVQIFGYSTAVGSTALGPLWEGLTISGGTYTYPSSAGQVVLVSSSASDTSALSIQIQGLDANFNLLSETIALNGTSNVTSVNSYFRINGLFTTNGTNVGTITAKIATVLYAQINPGVGQTQMAIYTVPNGYSFFITYLQANASIGFTSSTYMTYAEYNKLNLNNTPVGSASLGLNGYSPFVATGSVTLTGQSPFVQIFEIPYTIPIYHGGGTDMQWQIKASTGSPYVGSVFIGGYLVKNDAA